MKRYSSAHPASTDYPFGLQDCEPLEGEIKSLFGNWKVSSSSPWFKSLSRGKDLARQSILPCRHSPAGFHKSAWRPPSTTICNRNPFLGRASADFGSQWNPNINYEKVIIFSTFAKTIREFYYTSRWNKCQRVFKISASQSFVVGGEETP